MIWLQLDFSKRLKLGPNWHVLLSLDSKFWIKRIGSSYCQVTNQAKVFACVCICASKFLRAVLSLMVVYEVVSMYATSSFAILKNNCSINFFCVWKMIIYNLEAKTKDKRPNFIMPNFYHWKSLQLCYLVSFKLLMCRITPAAIIAFSWELTKFWDLLPFIQLFSMLLGSVVKCLVFFCSFAS